MNRLPVHKRVAILRCLTEGMSMRAVSRTQGVAFNSVAKLLRAAGEAALLWHDEGVRGVECRRIEADELVTYIWVKAHKRATAKAAPPDAGDSWTWVAIDPESKLVLSYLVADRSLDSGIFFMKDLRSRVVGRIQLTTDGWPSYPDAVEIAFGHEVDYATLIKTFGTGADPGSHYGRPRVLTGTERYVISGQPAYEHIGTAAVERNNLTIRMSNRRFMRKGNAFSKDFDQHMASVALHFWNYNFRRPHLSLRDSHRIRVTPAMAADLTYRPSKFEELVSLIDELAPKPNRPKRYRKRQRDVA